MAAFSLLTPRAVPARRIARWILAAVYMLAGIFHITVPEPFLLITPDWVPFPQTVIFATGLCELAGAAGLLTKSLRSTSGVCLALYAVCVYPANVKHAIDGLPVGQMQLGWAYHAPRLALQPILIWWALFAGEVLTWPFTRR